MHGIWPEQTFPQKPQLFSSFVVSMQTPLQRDCPDGHGFVVAVGSGACVMHWHVLGSRTWPLGHEDVQTSLHGSVPGGQLHEPSALHVAPPKQQTSPQRS